MASKEKINELWQLINRVPVLSVYIETTDLRWTMDSKLTTGEIITKIRAEKRPVALYKEILFNSLSSDLTLTVPSEECADELIKFWSDIGRDGIK